ncbi:MAG: hypothetical protein JWP35_932 [Caulobacter sp.]|nr:hypothetical protein [Caulobacter sp.]
MAPDHAPRRLPQYRFVENLFKYEKFGVDGKAITTKGFSIEPKELVAR